MSMETIGPIVMIVLLLVFLFVVVVGLNVGKGNAKKGGNRPRYSSEQPPPHRDWKGVSAPCPFKGGGRTPISMKPRPEGGDVIRMDTGDAHDEPEAHSDRRDRRRGLRRCRRARPSGRDAVGVPARHAGGGTACDARCVGARLRRATPPKVPLTTRTQPARFRRRTTRLNCDDDLSERMEDIRIVARRLGVSAALLRARWRSCHFVLAYWCSTTGAPKQRRVSDVSTRHKPDFDRGNTNGVPHLHFLGAQEQEGQRRQVSPWSREGATVPFSLGRLGEILGKETRSGWQQVAAQTMKAAQNPGDPTDRHRCRNRPQ